LICALEVSNLRIQRVVAHTHCEAAEYFAICEMLWIIAEATILIG